MTAIIIVALLALLVGMPWVLKRRNKLPETIVRRTWAHWEALKTITDPGRRVMEAEKILDDTFFRKGYRGSMADKLRSIGKGLGNIQSVWDAHKLRNRIAHEVGFSVSESDAQRSLSAFEKALRSLLS